MIKKSKNCSPKRFFMIFGSQNRFLLKKSIGNRFLINFWPKTGSALKPIGPPINQTIVFDQKSGSEPIFGSQNRFLLKKWQKTQKNTKKWFPRGFLKEPKKCSKNTKKHTKNDQKIDKKHSKNDQKIDFGTSFWAKNTPKTTPKHHFWDPFLTPKRGGVKPLFPQARRQKKGVVFRGNYGQRPGGTFCGVDKFAKCHFTELIHIGV